MTDINKQIEEEARETKRFIFEYCDKLALPYVLCDTKERHNKAKELAGASYQDGYKSALHSSRWRKVSEELPEDSMTLKNFTSNAKRTDLVLVRLVDGTIDTDARFVFLALGDNCWVKHKDGIIEWKPID